MSTALKFKKSIKKSQQEIVKPNPGSNSFHWFSYSQKVKLGSKYNYQDCLANWRIMSDLRKEKYQEMAKKSPKHKKMPGRMRAASAYDVLRRELTSNGYKEKLNGVNLNKAASEIRVWMVINHPNVWDEWLVHPEHLKYINRAVKSINWENI